MSAQLLIRNVRPYGDDAVDILIDGGEIVEIGASIDPDAAADVLDGAGAVLLPGFVDMHLSLIHI